MHTQRLAVNIGAATFEPWVYAELDDPDEGLNGVTICQLYDHVTARYAKILQLEIDKNKQVFEQGIDATKTLAIYIRKQEACLETSVDADDLFSDATMVLTGTRHAVATGNMQLAWRDWVRIPNMTWTLWKIHWTRAFQEKRELQILADVPIDAGFANSATEQKMGNNMVTALDNLANAAVQKNDTIETLVSANKNLTDLLAQFRVRPPPCDHHCPLYRPHCKHRRRRR